MNNEEPLEKRHGDNLYPITLSYTFNNIEMSLDVPEGVWNPTPNGIHLGNILSAMDFTNEDILELGTGCGIHAIILAKRGAKSLTLTEIDSAINANAKHNLQKNNVQTPVEFEVADWTHVKDSSHSIGKWDTVVANPPYAKSGKNYRRYFIDTLILDAHKLIKPGGRLIFIHSSMADIPKTLLFLEEQGMKNKILGETSGPFRDYYFEDEQYMYEMSRIPNSYHFVNGKHHERLIAIEATIPFT